MNRIRSHALGLLAGSLSVTLLAGCPNAGTQPPLNASAIPSAAASGTGSAMPTTGPSASSDASATSSPGNGTSPSGNPSTPVSAPPASGATRILSGNVYDEEGATVDGATVAVRSLDAARPYNATAIAAAGSYVVNDVPVGVQIEVSVTKAGWTRRTRVTSLQENVTNKAELFFGAPSSASTEAQTSGAAYFVSDFPEVASATPGASPITGDKLSYVVRFSEAMDEDARDLIEDSYSIETAPASTDVMPSGLTPDQIAATIVIRQNSSFLDGKRRVTETWNADNTEMTIAFDAPLRALDDDEKSYIFRLTRQTGDQEIQDADGNRLGFVATAENQAYFGIKKANLALTTSPATPQTRWEETHQRSTSFDVAEDETDPKAVSVDTTDVTRADMGNVTFLQINVTFSEAMRVYPDLTGYASSVTNLANYRLAFSDEDNELDKLDMEDTPTDFTGAGTVALERVLRFTAPSDAFIEPSEDDPKIVSIYVRRDDLPTGLKQVKVLVEPAVLDPAGNRVSDSNQDSTDNTADNVVLGDI